MQQMVIIGAGQTGHCAALALRQSGFDDRIVLVGGEPWLPYERPPLSKQALAEPELGPKFFTTEARYAAKAIEVRTGVVADGIDRDGAVYLSTGERLAYDRLLLATGGRSRRLGIPGDEHVRYLRTVEDAVALRAELHAAGRVLCIGGGVIGLEIAAAAATMGCEVRVAEAGDRIMNRCLAPGEAEYLQAVHAANGVEIRTGHAIVAVEKPARGGFAAHFADGSLEIADLIVAGIGMIRNSELAGDAGLEVDNGILVDELARTADEQIFAAGDVAACLHGLWPHRMRLESWYHAQNHGTCAGRTMAGAGRPYDDVPRYWTDQYDLNIQVAGFPAEAASTRILGDPVTRQFTALHEDAAGRLVGVTAVNQPRSIRPCLDIIGRGGVAPAELPGAAIARAVAG